MIGKGSFSKVLRASHRATGQKYAIKMIEKLSHESKESCDKELRVLRRTRHQNIIQLIEIYEGTKIIFVIKGTSDPSHFLLKSLSERVRSDIQRI